MTAEQFGPYVLESLLGVGGMGEVHRAHDTRRDRRVALKLLPESAPADDECLARFRREQQIAARLTDPHIVPIHDFGEIDGRLFLDMRLVEGRDLGQVLAEDGPLSPERAVALLGQVAEALDAAHADDLVHRDIKPSNILVTANDFAYVVDFGIARFLGTGQPQVTAVGTTVGTIAYMAPERFTDDAGDGRADVYALACVLFECLTGRRPFVGEDVAIIGGHLHGEPPRASALAEEVPEALDAVVRRGMAKAPDDRYGSAGELMAAAREALRAAAAVAPPRPAPETAGVPTGPETGGPRATGAPETTVPPPRTPTPVPGVPVLPGGPVMPGPGTPLRGIPVTGAPRRSGAAAYVGPPTPLRGTPVAGGPGTPLRGVPVVQGAGPGTPLRGIPATPGPTPGTPPRGVPVTGGRSGPVLWNAGPGRGDAPHPADVMPAAVPVAARPAAAPPSTAQPPPPARPRTRVRPRLLLLALVAVLVAGGVAMLRDSDVPVVLREPVGTAGNEPFMPSPGADGTGQPLIMNLSSTVTGDEPGLYGGTRTDACNSGQIASFLAAHPDHAAAWAGVQGVAVNEIPSFLATLTPVTLRTDTAVTNHGFKNGEATDIHSVLQAGTGVLVDAHGVPRVRCYCGNPLGPPTADSAQFRGANWPGFSPEAVTTIRASTAPVVEFVVVQQGTGDVVARPRGSDGEKDHPADPKDVTRVKVRDSSGGDAGHGAAGGRPVNGDADGTGAAVPPNTGASGEPGAGPPPTAGAATGDPVVPGTGATDAVVPPGEPAPPGGTTGQEGTGTGAPGTGSTPGDSGGTAGTTGGTGGASPDTAGGGTGSGDTGSGGTTGGGTTGDGTAGSGGTTGGGTAGTGGAAEGPGAGQLHPAVVPRSAATLGP